jgi:hypothetical protein
MALMKNNKLFDNFSSKRGGISNIDEAIDAFDLPMSSPDTLFLHGIKIATIQDTDYLTKFVSEDMRTVFKQELISSGLLDHIKETLKISEVPENIAVLIAVNRNLDEAYAFYNKDNGNKLLTFIDNMLKNKEEIRYDNLVNHRHELKQEEVKKSNKLIM